MKRFLLILAIFLPFALHAQTDTAATRVGTDSLRLARLDSALVYYTATIEMMDIPAKERECDFLITSANDPATSRHIALWLWDFYKESKLMGDEEVAIYIYDAWFKSGLIEMRSDIDRVMADVFVTFNRSTLLGREAPRIDLYNKRGRAVTIPSGNNYSILFFYDTECGKCRMEAKLLPRVLETIDFPCSFYAVCYGSDKAAWKKFRKQFKLHSRNVEVFNLWDPEEKSDFTRLYGVMSTPRLYVTDRDGIVIGRRLEVDNLQEIINYICRYGKEESKNLGH